MDTARPSQPQGHPSTHPTHAGEQDPHGSPIARATLSMFATGYLISQAIGCAAALEIADKLVDRPKSLEELASATGCSATQLRRLMRALCSIAVFAETASGYTLTPLSQCLRRDAPGSLWSQAMFNREELYKAGGYLLQALKGGESPWMSAIGVPFWEYLGKHPERSAIFDLSMTANHASDVGAMINAYDFSHARSLVDIGGGDGSLVAEILARYPEMEAAVFEREGVATSEASSRRMRESARIRFISGDFFVSIPGGFDMYVLRHVLHDWDDQDCLRILKRCRESMPPSARLLVLEMLLDGGESREAGWSDLGVMLFGGVERTRGEFESLLREAGFAIQRILPAGQRVHIIEAAIPG